MVVGALAVLALVWVRRQDEVFIRSRRSMPKPAALFAAKS